MKGDRVKVREKSVFQSEWCKLEERFLVMYSLPVIFFAKFDCLGGGGGVSPGSW